MPKPIVIVDDMKVCTSCKEWKPLTDYHSAGKNKSVLYASTCRECNAEYVRQYRARTKKKCKTCSKLVLRTSTYCTSCSRKVPAFEVKRLETRRKTNPRKRNYCIECSSEIKLSSIRCKKCNSSRILNNQWRGGVSDIRNVLRGSFEYRQWRSDVYTRDKFTCQKCFIQGSHLHAHHVVFFSTIMQKHEITTVEMAKECSELWNINNGITLCIECHKDIHKKGE